MPEERSIMQIISEMVREGETEDKIVETLSNLGITEAEAKRLLLVAQSHTFELLKSEIEKIVESHISEQKPELKNYIKKQISNAAEKRLALPKGKKRIEEQKARGFIAGLVEKIFVKSSPAEAGAGTGQESIEAVAEPMSMAESPFIVPEAEPVEIIEQEQKRLEEEKELEQKEQAFSLEKIAKIRKEKKKLSQFLAWRARYKKELSELQKLEKSLEKKRKSLPEKQVEKKVLLKEKIRGYKKKISETKKRIPKRIPKLAAKRRQAKRSVASFAATTLQLQTMRDLSQAAKTMMLAAEKIVQLAPKPKIVISGEENVLTTDQEIEKVKRLKRYLEIDFYKRRISLQDFQTKMIEYQSRLYELQEKKRILEKTKSFSAKREEKISPKLERLLQEKIGGRLSDDRMLEIENYAIELMKKYNVPEHTMETELRGIDMASLLSSMEKLATLTQLSMEARQALEKEKESMPAEATAKQTQQIQKQQAAMAQQMPAQYSAQSMEQQQKAMETLEKISENLKQASTMATVPQQGMPAQIVQQPMQQAKGKKGKKQQPMQTINIVIPEQKTQQAIQPTAGGQPINIVMPEQAQAPTRVIERQTAEQPPVKIIERETERVIIKPIEHKIYKTAPEDEPRKILVEPQKNWSEAEIPSFPTTVDKRKKEKPKSEIREITRFEITTDLDSVLQKIKDAGSIGLLELEKETGVEKQRLQELILILEEQDLVKVDYPAFGAVKIMAAGYQPPPKTEKQKPRQQQAPTQEPAKNQGAQQQAQPQETQQQPQARQGETPKQKKAMQQKKEEKKQA